MKTKVLFSAAAMLAGSILAAQADPKDDVTAAAQKLADSGNYSWHVTTVAPADSRFRPGPMDGKMQGGVIYMKGSFRDNTWEFYAKGTNIVVNDPDNGWETLADAESDQGPGRFIGMMARNFKTPAPQAMDLAADAKDLTQADGVYSGNLTEDGAKKLLAFRRGRRGAQANVSNPSGTVKFWVQDGQLTKFEYHVKGTMTFNDNDVTVDRDTTIEIKDAGATKIAMPDDVRKMLP